MPGREQGRVKWWNDDKGYGFLTSDAGQDYFVHYSAVEQRGRVSLEGGQVVLFTPASGEKGPKALEVVLAGETGEVPEDGRGRRRRRAAEDW